MGLVSSNNCSSVTDKNKLRNQRIKFLKRVQQKSLKSSTLLIPILLVEKKDIAHYNKEKGGKYCRHLQ